MAYVSLIFVVVVLYVLASRHFPDQLTAWGLRAERWHSGLTLRQAQVGSFAIPYLEGGSGEPLMLIHGFAGDKDNFTRVARFLTPHYRVLIPDLPGFGDAGRDPEARYMMADQVERLHTFLTQLGIAKVHLGGNSMGGFIAAQFAATYPAMVGSVWLIDAAGTLASHDTPILQHYLATGEMPLLLKDERDFGALLSATTHRRPFMPGFAQTSLGRRGVADLALHTAILRQLTDSPTLESQYRELATPAFVVWGAQDQILSPNGAATFVELFPRSQRKIMDGIGHLPMAEAPEESAMDYLAFRRSLAA